MLTMKTLFFSLLVACSFSLMAQSPAAYVDVPESQVPVVVQAAIDRDFPGEGAYSFTTLLKADIFVATIYRRESVLLATYNAESLLISTAERLVIERLPLVVTQRLAETFPGYELPQAFVRFRTIIDDEGILNYRVNMKDGSVTHLIIIDESGKIQLTGASPLASL